MIKFVPDIKNRTHLLLRMRMKVYYPLHNDLSNCILMVYWNTIKKPIIGGHRLLIGHPLLHYKCDLSNIFFFQHSVKMLLKTFCNI